MPLQQDEDSDIVVIEDEEPEQNSTFDLSEPCEDISNLPKLNYNTARRAVLYAGSHKPFTGSLEVQAAKGSPMPTLVFSRDDGGNIRFKLPVLMQRQMHLRDVPRILAFGILDRSRPSWLDETVHNPSIPNDDNPKKWVLFVIDDNQCTEDLANMLSDKKRCEHMFVEIPKQQAVKYLAAKPIILPRKTTPKPQQTQLVINPVVSLPRVAAILTMSSPAVQEFTSASKRRLLPLSKDKPRSKNDDDEDYEVPIGRGSSRKKLSSTSSSGIGPTSYRPATGLPKHRLQANAVSEPRWLQDAKASVPATRKVVDSSMIISVDDDDDDFEPDKQRLIRKPIATTTSSRSIGSFDIKEIEKATTLSLLAALKNGGASKSIQIPTPPHSSIKNAYSDSSIVHVDLIEADEAEQESEEISTGEHLRIRCADGFLEMHLGDLECLNEGTYINDSIINTYLRILYLAVFDDDMRQQFYFFNTFFYKKLSECKSAGDFKALMRWIKNVRIFDKRYLVVPIHESAHWYLAIICFPELLAAEEAASETELEENHHSPTVIPLPAPFSPVATKGSPIAHEDNARQHSPAQIDLSPGLEPSPSMTVSPMSAHANQDPILAELEETMKETAPPPPPPRPQSPVEDDERVYLLQDTIPPAPIRIIPESMTSQTTRVKRVRQQTKPTTIVYTNPGYTAPTRAVTRAHTEELHTQEAIARSLRPETENAPVYEEIISDGEDESKVKRSKKTNKVIRRRPCILIFDSLGIGRVRTAKSLRRFLEEAWKQQNSEETPRIFDGTTFPLLHVKAPIQPNSYDCGLYLLKNVEMFCGRNLMRPDQVAPIGFPDYRNEALNHYRNWYTQEECANMRNEIRNRMLTMNQALMAPATTPPRKTVEEEHVVAFDDAEDVVQVPDFDNTNEETFYTDVPKMTQPVAKRTPHEPEPINILHLDDVEVTRKSPNLRLIRPKLRAKPTTQQPSSPPNSNFQPPPLLPLNPTPTSTSTTHSSKVIFVDD